ncbi:MAG: AtpZ/AtpI family protein [Chloroflexi bacterium]|nr:AtpZ/AtpI family protein [Chloroflexota bacterium]
MGFYIGGSITLGVLGGLWLDKKWGTNPLFAILGLILGVILSFVIVYRLLKPLIHN